MNNQVSSTTRQTIILILTLVGLVVIPFLAFYLRVGNIPPDLFKYPPTKPELKEPVNTLALVVSFVIGLALLLLYLFPSIYGFKKCTDKHNLILNKKRFPFWFWIGWIVFLAPLILFSIQSEAPKWIVNWGLVPLFWGFVTVLDGFVYYVNDGKSLFNTSPLELIAIAVSSISGWLFFDYLNFYLGFNWFYPASHLVDFGHHEFTIYAVIGSSAFIPMAFQWYYLLRKIKILNTRYLDGPKIKSPKWLLYVLIGISIIGLIACTNKENQGLFFVIWVAPLIIITCILSLLGIWTPFTPLREGNWTALLTFALTFLIQGFFLEMWNYMSAEHIIDQLPKTYNAAYWIYSIPYVQKWLIFEMPLFGYLGYLFFSIHCYVWWITNAKLMRINQKFGMDDDFK